MKSVYVFGPIHIFGQDYLPVYKRLMKLCKKHFAKVIGTYPDFWNSKEMPREFYERTVKTITKCELFVGEVSSPSHGVGMELQMAAEKRIPLILLAKDSAEISDMVIGLPNIRTTIRYKNIEDLEKKLGNELQKIASRK